MLMPLGKTRELLIEALRYAFQVNQQDSFNKCLTRLAYCYYPDRADYICLLEKDFAPYSFLFSLYTIEDFESISINEYDETIVKLKEGSMAKLHGWLIYHGTLNERFGKVSDGVIDSSMSVQLVPSAGWSIHT